MLLKKINCYHCCFENSYDCIIGLRDECQKCTRDLHSCVNCRFYSKSSANECREPRADKVLEKDRANFCDFFEAGNAQAAASQKEEALKAAEALFKFSK